MTYDTLLDHPSTRTPRSHLRQLQLLVTRLLLLGLILCSSVVAWRTFSDLSPIVKLNLSTLRISNYGVPTCPPNAFDAGTWVRRPDAPSKLGSLEAIYAAMGTKGCKAGFQPLWNLGLRLDSSTPFEDRREPMSYQWEPDGRACSLRPVSLLDKLQELVERPLFIAGDSRSRQHFFQLSCELSAGVSWRGAKPEVDENAVGSWRIQQQHPFLDDTSAVAQHIRFPRHFDISKPIVTFSMSYIPLSRLAMRNLTGIKREMVPAENPSPEYPAYEIERESWLGSYVDVNSHYRAMLWSTGAHFGPILFKGAFDASDVVTTARASVRDFYREVTIRMRPDQRLLVRAAAAGQSDCAVYKVPLREVGRQGGWYNYDFISDINAMLRDETELAGDPRLIWLGLDRITRLRPDAHLPDDCLHYAIGTGVFENISRYMWHHLSS